MTTSFAPISPAADPLVSAVRSRHALVAAYLGWTLNAFDFFLMVFVLREVAEAFSVSVDNVAFAITLTLFFRPLGAVLFGRLADRFGRRPVNIARSRTRVPICSRVRSAQMCLGFSGGFAPTIRPAFHGSRWDRVS
ncbi:hypothetical protein [Xanthobacter sp. ZOL 2024]